MNRSVIIIWEMNIVQIGQQWWMFRNEEAPKNAAKESKKKDKKGRKG